MPLNIAIRDKENLRKEKKQNKACFPNALEGSTE